MKQKGMIWGLALASLLLGSCEHLVVTNSKVHEDGSIDKTIMLGRQDSSNITSNSFGIGEASGWRVNVQRSKKEDGSDEADKLDIRFEKEFPKAEAVNSDLDKEIDSLFRIHTTFEKSFRWFYTYIYYTETIRPIDRLRYVEATEYFAKEDFDFINRLPGEGIAISQADSIYLQLLNEKIFDQYAEKGLFEEHFEILKEVVRRNTNDLRWIDSLVQKRSSLYSKLEKDDAGNEEKAIAILDTLGIKLDREKAIGDFLELANDYNARLGFMSFAQNGKYVNSIEMPWTVIRSNADSIAGNTLYWKPLATKFAISNFTMTAESRRFNWWAAALTAVLIGVTIFLFTRRKSS